MGIPLGAQGYRAPPVHSEGESLSRLPAKAPIGPAEVPHPLLTNHGLPLGGQKVPIGLASGPLSQDHTDPEN